MAPLRGLLLCSLLLLGCVCKQALGTRLLGGLQDASPEEPDVRTALQFAMNQYNRGSNDVYHNRVSEVVRAQKQIVSGINYYFTVKIGRTVCRKGASDLENCAFHNTPKLAKSEEIGDYKSVRWHTIRNMHWKECGDAGSPEEPHVCYAIKPMYSPLTTTCTFEVYNIPWRNIITLEKNACT